MLAIFIHPEPVILDLGGHHATSSLLGPGHRARGDHLTLGSQQAGQET
jgi:hypothetical protein